MANEIQKGNKPEGCIIQRCTCINEYQDKRYGKNMRVKNNCLKQGSKSARCTVCNHES